MERRIKEDQLKQTWESTQAALLILRHQNREAALKYYEVNALGEGLVTPDNLAREAKKTKVSTQNPLSSTSLQKAAGGAENLPGLAELAAKETNKPIENPEGMKKLRELGEKSVTDFADKKAGVSPDKIPDALLAEAKRFYVRNLAKPTFDRLRSSRNLKTLKIQLPGLTDQPDPQKMFDAINTAGARGLAKGILHRIELERGGVDLKAGVDKLVKENDAERDALKKALDGHYKILARSCVEYLNQVYNASQEDPNNVFADDDTALEAFGKELQDYQNTRDKALNLLRSIVPPGAKQFDLNNPVYKKMYDGLVDEFTSGRPRFQTLS